MTSPSYPQFVALVILAGFSAVTANQDERDVSDVTLQHLRGDDFGMMTSFPLLPLIFAPTSTAITNQLCRNDSLLFLESLKNATLWALEMFDSSAKFPTGIFVGVTQTLGNYGECLSVKANVPDGDSPGRGFIGKYCLAKVEIPPSKLPTSTNAAWDEVKRSVNSLTEPAMNVALWAICMPSSCSANDLKLHLKYVLPKLDQLKPLGIPVDNLNVIADEKLCSTVEDNSGFTTGQAALVFIIVALLFLICLGSAVNTASEKLNLMSKGYVAEVLLCFSLQRNLKKLFHEDKPTAALEPVSGLKFLTMTLIIFNHRFMFSLLKILDNPRVITEKYDDVDFSILLNGNFVVDTFFFISGYLLSYFALRNSAKLKSPWHILYFYFRRYIRLTPVHMFIVAFIATVCIKLESDPIWNYFISAERDRCLENWWLNALYLNNVFGTNFMCFQGSWYLAVDMQLYLVSVPIVYLIVNKPKIGKTILGISLTASVIIPFAVIYQYHFDPVFLGYTKNLENFGDNDAYKYVYIPSHMRASPYFMGILGGCFVHHFNNNNVKFSQMQANWIIIGMFTLGFLPSLTSSIFYQKNYEYNVIVAAAQGSLQRLSWGVAVFFLIIVFNARKEWYVMKILSLRIFVPLSRLTYSAFLIHLVVQIYDLASHKTPLHLSWFHTFLSAFGDITLAYLISLAVSMMLDTPCINLEKLFFNKNETRATEKTKLAALTSQKCTQMDHVENAVKECLNDEEVFLKEQLGN